MNSILIPVAALVALVILRPVLRILIAAVGGRAIGRAALAKVPETIHLTAADAGAFRNAATVQATSSSIRSLGFVDVGAFRVPEVPGLALELLVNSAASCYAVVYDHPRAGMWFEMLTRYADGTSASVSTSPPNGIAPRPGHPVTHLPGRDARTVFARLQADRPQSVYAPHDRGRVVRDFEQGYVDGLAWRKQHGISTREVVNVALKKAA